ncbi:MAG: DUF1549 domain-containing protein, partial [Planctomycetaceae bacterium]|nr:DUF1549 domain-containing protein [Planctomycetaceae bacterium]
MNRSLPISLACVLVAWAAVAAPFRCSADDISFATQIRPILSDKCFKCHGPDENKREAGLRFDLESSAKSKLESGSTAIVPGNLDASSLIERIRTTDADLKMPPDSAEKPLTAAETQLLTEWIRGGANWESHWAFDTVQRPPVPQPVAGQPVRNEIDPFIQQRLHAAGLSMNPEADRVTLIRRVTFDLTGLPPTVEEVDNFVNDPSPEAYRKVVERLLQSPHYGEHQARFWLDAARYGDTHGLHLD